MTYVTKILLALAISEAVVAGKYVHNETINAKYNYKIKCPFHVVLMLQLLNHSRCTAF